MAFLAGAIAAGIGLTGTALTIGTALISTAFSIGLGFASQALQGRPRTGGSGGARGISLNLQTSTDVPRAVIFGKQATGGSLVFWTVSGADNKRLQMVIALADHECDGLDALYMNGKRVTLDGAGAIAEYPGSSVRFYSGAAGQAADADVIAASQGDWTVNHRGVGVCYAVVDLNYDAEKFTSGIPKFLFIVRGLKVYDPRKDVTVGGVGSHLEADPATWEFSRNPVLLWRAWHRGLFTGSVRIAGMSTPVSMLPVQEVIAVANACDEPVTLEGGGTEPRYRCDAHIETHRPHRDVIMDLVASMAGKQIDSGGLLRVQAGVAQTPVLSLTDADLMVAGDVEIQEKLPRSELINAIFGTYSNPDDAYNLAAIAPRVSAADEAADGGRLEHSYELDAVTSGSQAQRMLEIERRLARKQARISFLGRAGLSVLEAGDWVTWTSARYGWIDRVFEVVNAPLNTDLTVPLSLREVSADVFAWSVLDERDRALPAEMPSSPPPFNKVVGHALANVTLQATGNASRPGLRLTFPAIADPTVDRLRVQYRKSGEADALEVMIEDPASGSHFWVDGVQGNTEYEARVLPVVVPQRTVTWSAWVPSGSVSDPHVVDGAETTGPPGPGTVEKDTLSAQVRFELELITQADELLASLGWVGEADDPALDALLRDFDNRERDREAEGRTVSLIKSTRQEMFDKVGGAEALIVEERQVRADADGALAQSVNSVSTSVNGLSTRVTEVQTSVDGHSASYGVVIDSNGFVVGAIQLSGSSGSSSFDVVADKFRVAFPNVSGGDPVPVFAVQDVGGVAKLALRGDMIADGGILARSLQVGSLSAIAADMGEITAGLLRSTDNLMRIDLTSKEIVIETAPA